MTTYNKVKSASKIIVTRSQALEEKVLKTLSVIKDIVGATLGPGGAPVLLERQEFGLSPLVTKDGVTVVQALGFDDPIAHAILESTRDAALKTAAEAGDGTTTATVLAWAIVLYAQRFRTAHPEVPVQRIAERLRDVFEDKLLPALEKLSKEVDYSTDAGKKLVRAVATISANGDEKLADAVMECFDLVGDQGTVAISEKSGRPSYQVEKIEGFPVPVGYEDSTARFMNAFMNDPQNGRVFMRRPYFLLFNGVVTDVQAVFSVLDRLQGAYLNRPGRDGHDETKPFIESPNIVLVAHGFSEQVLGTLAINFNNPEAIRTLPLVTPRSALQNGETHFLDDLAAVTGATVFDLTQQKGFDSAVIPGEGDALDCDVGSSEEFEMLRWRSTVIGKFDSDAVADRARVLEGMVASASGELDARMIRDRLAALTGGIAKLWVVGGSQGELRERKDRADDAVRAVQGATRSGVLPGGGWALMRLATLLQEQFEPSTPEFEVLSFALQEPVRQLLNNTGMSDDDATTVMLKLSKGTKADVWDAAKFEWVNAYRGGILDSTPAVREAIRSSISIATLHGTLGGLVVYGRDHELDRREAEKTNEWVRNTNTENEANIRT